jgi:hypothetical protein
MAALPATAAAASDVVFRERTFALSMATKMASRNPGLGRWRSSSMVPGLKMLGCFLILLGVFVQFLCIQMIRDSFFLFRLRQGCATQNMAKDAHFSWTNTLKQKLATAPIRWN